jgi:ATP-dependent Zn protease
MTRKEAGGSGTLSKDTVPPVPKARQHAATTEPIGTDGDGELPDFLLPDAPAKVSRLDPAEVAARLMVLRAVRDGRAVAKVRRPYGLAVVSLPDPEWLGPVVAVWRALFRDGMEPGDGEAEIRHRSSRKWIAFQRDGSDRKHAPENGNDIVEHAAWKGIPVVGFASAPERYLPSQLMRSPDCRIAIGPMDEAMLRTVIRGITGRGTLPEIPANVPAALTPNILRLARRPRQSAAAYLKRLLELASARTPAGRPGPLLEDIRGMEAATSWGMRWVRDLAEYRDGKITWRDVDAGALLHGAPGTGKTMFAEALARSAKAPLVATSFSTWQGSKSGYLGDCLRAMRASFDEAKRLAPSILFIDEMDAVGSRSGEKGEHRDYWTAIVTGLLELLDGIGGREGVLVLGATNDPGALDPAILRSGRMDRLIEIERPDRAALEGILRHHLRGDLGGTDLVLAARLASGGTGADCARWVRSARQSARHAGRPVSIGDLLDAIGGSLLTADVERRIAVHEAGHAVATAVLRPGAVVEARIGGKSIRGGEVAARTELGTTRGALRGCLIELLAGRAAEEVLLGGYSGGSGGSSARDLATATCIAVAQETALGLGSIGPMWLGMPTASSVGLMLAHRPPLAATVQDHLEAVHADAVALVREHLGAVTAVADRLLIDRMLTGDEIASLVAAHPAAAPETALP